MNQLVIESRHPSLIDQQDGQNGSRNDGQQSRRRRELIAKHLLVSPLQIQHTGVGKHVEETDVEHQVIHPAESLHRFFKNQTYTKYEPDRNIGKGVDTGNICIIFNKLLKFFALKVPSFK